MAQLTQLSTKELQRQAQLAFEGQTIKVMLCNQGATTYTAESTVANWQSIEVTGPGYTRYSATIGTGSYSTTVAAYVLPDINAGFTCTSTPWNYTHIVIYIDGQTYPHSVIRENPTISLAAGQSQTYRLTLRQDD